MIEDGIATPGLTIAYVSVGQQITVAAATVYDSTARSSEAWTRRRAWCGCKPTTLWGTLNTDGTLDLLTLGRFARRAFSFTGTGTPEARRNAERLCGRYERGATGTGAATTGELLQVEGTVSPFGTAPPDFTARRSPRGRAHAADSWWSTGARARRSTTPSASITSAGLVVNLADADLGATHEIRTGPATLDLKSLPASPLITTAGADQSNLPLAVGSTTLTHGHIGLQQCRGVRERGRAALQAAPTRSSVWWPTDSTTALTNTFVASRINVALHESARLAPRAVRVSPPCPGNAVRSPVATSRRALNIADLRDIARRRVPGFVFEYVESGAEDETTLRGNREALERLRLIPQTLVDTSQPPPAQHDPRTARPTRRSSSRRPGLNGLLHPDADVTLARAAAKLGVPYTLSTVSTTRLEEVAQRAGGRLWMQLYVVKERAARRATSCSVRRRPATRRWCSPPMPTCSATANGISAAIADRGSPTLHAALDAARHPRWLAQVLVRHGMPRFRNLEPSCRRTSPPWARAPSFRACSMPPSAGTTSPGSASTGTASCC